MRKNLLPWSGVCGPAWANEQWEAAGGPPEGFLGKVEGGGQILPQGGFQLWGVHGL